MNDRLRKLPNGIPVVPLDKDGFPVVGQLDAGGGIEKEVDPIWSKDKPNYYNKEQIDNLLYDKYPLKTEVYTRTEIDNKNAVLQEQIDENNNHIVDHEKRIKTLEDSSGTTIDAYTKAESDAKFATIDNTYNKSEVYKKDEVYSKTGIDSRLEKIYTKAETMSTQEIQASQKVQDDRITALEDGGTTPADTYTKAEIDEQQKTQDEAIKKNSARIDGNDTRIEGHETRIKTLEDGGGTPIDTYTKEEIDAQQKTQDDEIAKKANSSDVYLKTQTYSKEEIDASQQVQDDRMDIYDTNFNNIEKEYRKVVDQDFIDNELRKDIDANTSDVTDLKKRLTVAPLAVANIVAEDVNGDEEVILALDVTKFYSNGSVFKNEQLSVTNTDISDPTNMIIVRGMLSVMASEDTGVGVISVKCTGEANAIELKETIDLKANEYKLIPFEYLLAGDTSKIELKIAATAFAAMRQLKVNSSYVTYTKVK